MSEGLSFGAYRAVRKVGQGGMGAVYLGEHTLIGRRAAIKVLHRDRSSQRESIERFFTEARATSAVEDPGIVQIYDFGVTPEGTAYLVMEYLDGEPLSARLRRLRLLSPYDAVRITRQLAGSLSAAHALGIVHRDLKPENLFMVRDAETLGGERAKILDFGIAKLGDDVNERFRTRTGVVMGTPAYMSPEQCNDSGRIDHRTDIYSLGCVLFHLLTGRPPFDVDGVGATIAAHLKESVLPPSQVAPHVPVVVDPLVMRCLAKRPEDRFASMVEVQQACDAVLAQLPAESATVIDMVPPIAVRDDSPTTLGTSVGQSSPHVVARRRTGMWIGVSIAAAAIGVVLAVVTTSKPATAPVTPAAAAPIDREEPVTPPPPAPPPPVETAPAAPTIVETKPEPAVETKPEPPPEPAAGSAKPPRKVAPKKPKKPPSGLYDDRI